MFNQVKKGIKDIWQAKARQLNLFWWEVKVQKRNYKGEDSEKLFELLEGEALPMSLLQAVYNNLSKIQGSDVALAGHVGTPLEWRADLLTNYPSAAVGLARNPGLTKEEFSRILKLVPVRTHTVMAILKRKDKTIEYPELMNLLRKPIERLLIIKIVEKAVEIIQGQELNNIIEIAIDVWGRRYKTEAISKEMQNDRVMFKQIQKLKGEWLEKLVATDPEAFWEVVKEWSPRRFRQLSRPVVMVWLQGPKKEIRIELISKLAQVREDQEQQLAIRASRLADKAGHRQNSHQLGDIVQSIVSPHI